MTTPTSSADYKETADITEVHAAIKREKPDPTPGQGPVPLWLMAFGAAVLLWAGAYLGMFHGGFNGEVFDEQLSSPSLLFTGKLPTVATEAAASSPVAMGKAVYTQNCVTCHQANGQGVPGAFPPLAGSDWMTGSSKRAIMILLKGIQGPLTVNGTTYNGQMPAWEKLLNDKKIAAVLTYARQEWGNSAPAVTPEEVAAVRSEFATRAEPWTEADLKAVATTAPAPAAAAPAPAASPAPAAAAP